MYAKHQAYQQYDKLKKEEMVREHLPLVYRLARQVMNATGTRGLEMGDLVNVGVIGLYRALDKYDETKGFPFGAFATHHVKGTMLDEINKNAQIPRSLRDKHNKVKAALEHLHQKLMRDVKDEEVAEYLGLDIEEYHEWLVHLGWTTAWSLEELEAAGTLQVVDDDSLVNPGVLSDRRETKTVLEQAIRRLSDKEQKVLYLFYEEELTIKEIAYVLDVSESYVSRIHSKAVLRLRGALGRKKADLGLK